MKLPLLKSKKRKKTRLKQRAEPILAPKQVKLKNDEEQELAKILARHSISQPQTTSSLWMMFSTGCFSNKTGFDAVVKYHLCIGVKHEF